MFDYKEEYNKAYEDLIDRGIDEQNAECVAHQTVIDKYADMIDWFRMVQKDKHVG